MTKPQKYPKHSIGEHVIPFSLVFDRQTSVKEALANIRKKVGTWPNSESVFVVDMENKLIGSVDFKKLVSSKETQILENIMNKDFIYLTDHSHQQSAIKIASKSVVESIPVVNKDGQFQGIIDSGQIFKIMHEEHIEKLMHFSGILSNEEFVDAYKSKITSIVTSRLPWLVLGLVGGIISTLVVKVFDYTLQKELSLAFFIPVVVYMNAAVGNQTLTIFIRYSSVEKVSIKKALWYELQVAVIVGAVLSFIIFLFATAWLGLKVGQIVSISMFMGVVLSVVITILFPWILEKLGKDPAIGSGPFTTILQDLLSIVIYFSIASLLL